MRFIAKVAMCLSFVYYALLLAFIWLGQMTGLHNDTWDIFSIAAQPAPPAAWKMFLGILVSVFAIGSLAFAYRSIWRILNGGPGQDFLDLSKRLRRLGLGLIGFWLGYNLLSGAIPYVFAIGLPDNAVQEFEWDPLDTDIIFVILGIAFFAISRTLQRAWEIEDENNHFL
ncbi:MAG: hypothetical protein ACSHXB_04185 [Sulfitobacter sp.]